MLTLQPHAKSLRAILSNMAHPSKIVICCHMFIHVPSVYVATIRQEEDPQREIFIKRFTGPRAIRRFAPHS